MDFIIRVIGGQLQSVYRQAENNCTKSSCMSIDVCIVHTVVNRHSRVVGFKMSLTPQIHYARVRAIKPVSRLLHPAVSNHHIHSETLFGDPLNFYYRLSGHA